MNPITHKVLSRLNLECLLITSAIQSSRVRITLPEIFQAGKDEPRIFEVLPALLVYKPSVIYRLDRDKKKYPEIDKIQNSLFDEKHRPKIFMGIPTTDCVRVAVSFKRFLDQKKTKQKSKTLTLRLAEEDIDNLKRLTKKMGTSGISETIRRLAAS